MAFNWYCCDCNSYSYVPVIIITAGLGHPGIWRHIILVLSTICEADIITLTLQMSTLKEISQGHLAMNIRARIHVSSY